MKNLFQKVSLSGPANVHLIFRFFEKIDYQFFKNLSINGIIYCLAYTYLNFIYMKLTDNPNEIYNTNNSYIFIIVVYVILSIIINSYIINDII